MMSSRATPAGGAAAAAAVAHAAALLCKSVCIGAKRDPASDHRALIERLATLARRAAEYFDIDSSAFAEVLAARRADDPPRLRAAWENATRVPLELATLARAALDELPEVRRRAPRAMWPDVEAARQLLDAGIAIALANARANLGAVEGPASAKLKSELSRSSERARISSGPPDREALDREALVDVTKTACLKAAAEAVEQGGYAGLCSEGRLELAVDAIRGVSIRDVLAAIDGKNE